MKKDDKQKKKVIQTSYIQAANYLYEQIGDTFLRWDTEAYNGLKDKNNFLLQDVCTKINSIEEGNQIYKPIDDDLLKNKAILLPSRPEQYKTEEKLIKEIQAHIHKWLDISPEMEFIAAHYVVLTWIYDTTNTICYLRAQGDTGTGKSRYLEVIGGLCYKPIKITGAVTPAPIYRVQQKWKGTLIIDEADFNSSDEKSEVITILNSGFQRGTPVIKVDVNDLQNIQAFDVYGPKIIGTTLKHYFNILFHK